ncbi:MAG TPA: thiolase family protein, partial [Stellaceae bacterium]|nr:thiolase family protein [Stellaceae bacterium]
MKSVVIAGYARSPFHFAKKGALARVRPDDMCAQVIAALVDRTKIDPATLEDVIVGCAMPEGEQGLNIARLASFLAHLPITVAGTTVNRFCGSSMQSVHMAAGAIQLDAGDAFICAGIESMTRIPMGGFNPSPNRDLVATFPAAYMSMGETAENVARKYQVTRTDQDAFSARSHRKAAAAQSAGKLAAEIVPIKSKNGAVDKDGCIRPDTTPEILAGLQPAFE